MKWYLPRYRDECKVLRYMLEHIDPEDGPRGEYAFQAYEIKTVEPDHMIGLAGFDTDGLMSLDVPNLPAVLEHLRTMGYIDTPYQDECDECLVCIPITDKGRFFFSNGKRATVKFLVCSLLIPIVVSIITAAITTRVVQ